LTANGRRSTFHSPRANRTGANTISVERRIGVFTRVRSPDRRLSATARTLVASGAAFGAIRTNTMHAAEKTNVTASNQNARSRLIEARSPAAAKPTAVDPNELIERKAFAEASSSSEATSGSTLCWAGSKNCLTPLATRTTRYRNATS